jgi:hypothetical protein
VLPHSSHPTNRSSLHLRAFAPDLDLKHRPWAAVVSVGANSNAPTWPGDATLVCLRTRALGHCVDIPGCAVKPARQKGVVAQRLSTTQRSPRRECSPFREYVRGRQPARALDWQVHAPNCRSLPSTVKEQQQITPNPVLYTNAIIWKNPPEKRSENASDLFVNDRSKAYCRIRK